MGCGKIESHPSTNEKKFEFDPSEQKQFFDSSLFCLLSNDWFKRQAYVRRIFKSTNRINHKRRAATRKQNHNDLSCTVACDTDLQSYRMQNASHHINEHHSAVFGLVAEKAKTSSDSTERRNNLSLRSSL